MSLSRLRTRTLPPILQTLDVYAHIVDSGVQERLMLIVGAVARRTPNTMVVAAGSGSTTRKDLEQALGRRR